MILLFVQLILSNGSSKSIKSAFDRLTFQDITGNYLDNDYVNSHEIPKNYQSVSTGDKANYPLSNIFTDNNKYWVSQYTNNDTFFSSISITFPETVLFEGFIYGASYRSGTLTREYDGFPTKLRLYTSLKEDDEFSLNSIFSGIPSFPLKNAQFILSKPIECKRIKIEFAEVTPDNSFSGGNCNAVMRYLRLFKSFGYDNLTYGVREGNHANANYINFHKVPTNKFNYSSTGDRQGHPLSYAFDNVLRNSFWVSDQANSDTFHSSIFVNFTEPVLLEAIHIAAAYRTPNERYYDGYPTVLGLHVSGSENEELKLHSMFYGTPTGKNDYFAFVLANPVMCKNVQLEFIDVTPDASFSSNAKNAVTAEIIFLQSFANTAVEFEMANGFYEDKDYLSERKIPTDKFEYSSTGDRDGFPLKNAFDDKTDSYWVAKEVNNDTFTNSVFITFKEPTVLEAILFDSSYNTRGESRSFNGFPIRFNVYTSLNEDEEYTLSTQFTGTPVYPLTRAQFVLKNPVNCSRVKLEFAQVTGNSRCSNQEVPEVGNFIFIKYLGYNYIEYKITTGYIESHVVPYSKFSYSSTGDRKGHPISLAFDGKIPSSYWVSDQPNSDTFHSSIFINFTEPVLLEGFIIYAAYKTTDGNREYHGYPLILKVKTAYDDDEPLITAVAFSGTPTGVYDNFMFELKSPVSCKRLQLEFVDVTPDNSFSSGAKAATTAEIKILADTKNYSEEIKTDDWQTLHVNKSIAQETISNIDFEKIKIIDEDEDYLFVVEKKFNFDDVNFACEHIPTSAIRSEEVPKVTVNRCTFDSCKVKNSQVDGGAIYSKNCGFKCESSDFKSCTSKENGKGGGVYFVIDKQIDDEIIFDNCNFTECKASNGAGMYMHCSVEDKQLTILNCMFSSNSLYKSESSSGSGIYINALNFILKLCSFRKNKGSSCKIVGEFENAKSIKLLSFSSISVLSCTFEIDEKSKSSLCYTGNCKENVNIKDCVFKGKLSSGSHHISIDSVAHNFDFKNIHIDSCKFSSDVTNSINMKSLKFVDLNSQIFNYNDEEDEMKANERKETVKSLYNLSLYFMFLFAGVLIAAAIVIIVSIKFNQNDQINLANEDI